MKGKSKAFPLYSIISNNEYVYKSFNSPGYLLTKLFRGMTFIVSFSTLLFYLFIIYF